VAAGLVACGGDGDSGDGTVAKTGTVEAAGGAGGLFSSRGFGEALDAIEAEVGADPGLLEIQVKKGSADFTVRRGERAKGLRYRTRGDVEPFEVEAVGPGTFEGRDFPLSDVDPVAVDEIVAGVREASGVNEFRPTTLTLEKDVAGVLRWLIIGTGGGPAGLIYYADPDGSNIQSQKELVGKAPGAR
jgi:hypothetical protein